MQSALAFGIAKNVNARQPGARRAASAYNMTGRHLSPSSSSASLSSMSPADPLAEADGGPALLALSAAGSSPLSSSSSCSSIASMVNGDLKALGLGDLAVGPRAGALAGTAPSSPEHLVSQRSNSVDKTNPFIGYFQAAKRGASAAPAPSSAPSAVGVNASTVVRREGLLGSYRNSSAALLGQQKKITEWIGGQSSRLPSFFARREDKPPLASTKKPSKKMIQAEDLELVETAPVALFDDYSMAAAGTAVEEKQEEEESKRAAPAIAQLVQEHEVGTRRRASSSFSTVSTSNTSRFEQDFEVIGTLGEGGQGTVFKVRSRVDGCAYAIKKVVLPPSLQRDSAAFHQALREVKAMAGMGTHVNVVRYHTAWLEETAIEQRVKESEIKAKTETPMSSEDENDNESSVASSFFSDGFSVNSLSRFDSSTSMGGFHFESSRSLVAEAEQELLKSISRRPLEGVKEDVREDVSETSSEESTMPETQLVLYIQMELCGSAAVQTVATEAEEEAEADSFQRLINRVTLKSQRTDDKKGEVVHSTLASWLRASVEARAAPDEKLTKHREGLNLLLGVVQGVQHMHQAGVIHRDLKPDNIFIHGDVPKIGDFGLSKAITSDPCEVSTEKRQAYLSTQADDHTTALGTFTYASPEQLGYSWNRSKGKASQLVKTAKYSIKSDIFALGIILLELCYPCSTMMERSQVLTAVRHGVVPQVALQRFPDEMALVLRMTSMDPADRPTTEEISEQLRSLLATKETQNVRAALDELRDLQQKLALAVMQLRDRSQTAQQLESLVAELSDKVQSVGLAIA